MSAMTIVFTKVNKTDGRLDLEQAALPDTPPPGPSTVRTVIVYMSVSSTGLGAS